MRFYLAAISLLAACGGAAAPSPAPRASTPEVPAATDEPQRSAADESPVEATATVSAAPAAKPTPDTPICNAFKQVVSSATSKFADVGAVQIPGAASCTVVQGGSGHTSTSTYTCEFGTAPDEASLTPKRDELTRALSECGSARASQGTRVRLVKSGGAVHLVVNVHDTARW